MSEQRLKDADNCNTIKTSIAILIYDYDFNLITILI
jgi:hypothetical protein